MTTQQTLRGEKQVKSKICALLFSLSFTILIFLSAIFLSDEMSRFVADGLLISVKIIIPSVFPFLLLTDITMRYIHFERIGVLRRCFERLFNINGSALSVYVLGILGGFPIGAKLALMMYENGKISRSECERLMAFSNNASPGYVICALGLGMWRSLRIGILFYFITVFSSLICGILIGIRGKKSNNTDIILWQKYSFVESTREATGVCLNITGFITVFSIIVGLAKEFIDNDRFLALIIPFLEIGNAGVYLSDLCTLPRITALALTAFAISFSGLCVAAQTMSLASDRGKISVGRYLLIKLLQGCISIILTLLLAPFLKI